MKKKKKYAILGNVPEQGQSKKAFILEIDNYEAIDPKEFFITTGEATVKIDVLLKRLEKLTKDVRKLKKKLIDTKGESDYLETCWEDRDLIVKKKEKRSRAKKDKDGNLTKPGKSNAKSK